jgi:hypothetical protein
MPLQAKQSQPLPRRNAGPELRPINNGAKISSQTVTAGASIGTSLPLSKSINLLPFGSAAFAHTRVAVDVGGNSGSASDNYVLFGFGAGFQLTPSLVIRPSVSLAAATDNTDDTVFGVSMTFALPHRGR